MKISDIALMYATEAHKGQFRVDGKTEYIEHPKAVAELVRRYKKSHNIERLVAAAYLHDVLEDTHIVYYDLVETFGSEIASIVLEVTTMQEMKDDIGKQKYLAYTLKNMTNWALVIKLCDRLHNLQDIENISMAKRVRLYDDTKFILEYVEQNRKDLTQTHLRIIDVIWNVLNNMEMGSQDNIYGGYKFKRTPSDKELEFIEHLVRNGYTITKVKQYVQKSTYYLTRGDINYNYDLDNYYVHDMKVFLSNFEDSMRATERIYELQKQDELK